MIGGFAGHGPESADCQCECQDAASNGILGGMGQKGIEPSSSINVMDALTIEL